MTSVEYNHESQFGEPHWFQPSWNIDNIDNISNIAIESQMGGSARKMRDAPLKKSFFGIAGLGAVKSLVQMG